MAELSLRTMSFEERFHTGYMPVTETGCWLWTRSATTYSGYGMLRKNRDKVLAHRVSWELHYGPVPEGMQVCHKCDVPLCVNPNHLFIGSRSDNMRDKVKKGRHFVPNNRGERHGLSRLKTADVQFIRDAIRNDLCTQLYLAELFRVTPGHISSIIKGTSRAHG